MGNPACGEQSRLYNWCQRATKTRLLKVRLLRSPQENNKYTPESTGNIAPWRSGYLACLMITRVRIPPALLKYGRVAEW